MLAGGRQPNQMRSALSHAGGWEPWGTPGRGGWGSWEPWGTAGGIENGCSSGSAMVPVHDVTVADEDVDVLECGICYHPLKPPIFQCYERLKDAVRCHVCRAAMPGGYQRCHAMERVVDSVRMPCPHAQYGCDTRTAYHARKEHIQECLYAPCHCPGDACGFLGPVATLVTHLKVAHGWPCTAEVRAGESFHIDLRIGFNFLTAVRGSTQYLLLLNMASTPFGHAISAVWIPSLTTMAISSSAPAASKNTTCELELSWMQFQHVQPQRGHYERSPFQVECMCPSQIPMSPSSSSSQSMLVETEMRLLFKSLLKFSSDQTDGSWTLRLGCV